MKTNKKNRFLTFCFSMMPGAAEMYMGFMKTGVSLMLLFFLIVVVAGWIQQAVIVMFAIVIWFYSFFHANHLAGLSDEDFRQVKDEYLFGMESLPGAKVIVEKHHTLVACVLIFIGVCFLWNSLTELMYVVVPESYQFIVWTMRRIGNYVPSVLIGIAIIVIGIKMMSGRKVEIGDQEVKGETIESREVPGKDER